VFGSGRIFLDGFRYARMARMGVRQRVNLPASEARRSSVGVSERTMSTTEVFTARSATDANRYADKGAWGSGVAGITRRDLDQLLRVFTATADSAVEAIWPGIDRVIPSLASMLTELSPSRLPDVAKEWAAAGAGGGSPDVAADLLGELTTEAFRAYRTGGDLYLLTR
jgi:hypothetical protein